MNQEPHQTTPKAVPPQQAVQVSVPESAPYVTFALVGVTVLVYLLQVISKLVFDVDKPADLLIKSNTLIRSWQVWRLFTSVLLHVSIWHVGLNMYALFVLGRGLERHFGHARFLLLFVIGSFTGNVASLLLASTDYSLGAGSAVFGLLGAEIVFLYQNRRLFGQQARNAVGNVIFIVVLNLFIVGLLPGVNIWGNIGGLLGGLFFAWYAGPLWDVVPVLTGFTFVDQRKTREVIVGAVMVFTVFGAVAVWWIMR